MNEIARSVVDNRQPFFRMDDGSILDVKTRVELDKDAHLFATVNKDPMYHIKCACWSCNKDVK
jgi:hypothetical protein